MIIPSNHLFTSQKQDRYIQIVFQQNSIIGLSLKLPLWYSIRMTMITKQQYVEYLLATPVNYTHF